MVLLIALTGLAGLSFFLIRDGAPLDDRTRGWVIVMAVGVAMAGMLCRLVGFDRSLWIDEFGTLWAIDGSFAETWTRVVGFHGQSPLYYLLLWPLIHGLGESEVLLRLPSLVCGVATALVIYRTGRILQSTEAGLFAAMLAWGSASLMASSVDARPYALALLLAALALHGFARAVLTADRPSRALFIMSGAALFLTHYLSSLIMLGLAAGYVCFSPLRTHYRYRAFLTDVALQIGAVLLVMPQLSALWRRREGLDWIGAPDYLLFLSVLGPFLLPIVVASFLTSHTHRVQVLIERTFALAMAAQAGVLTLIAAWGINLLAPRYLMVSAVPASLAAGLGLSRLRTPVALVSAVFAIALGTVFSVTAWRTSGVPTVIQNQDWRRAVDRLDAEISAAPGAFVLYRPGFVEQDVLQLHSAEVLRAPLRSPGRTAPHWPLVPLTFSWSSPSREPYFQQVLVPALDTAQVFFVLVCGTTPKTGNYGPLMVQWIEQTFPDRFTRRSVGPFAGIDVWRFDRRPQSIRRSGGARVGD